MTEVLLGNDAPLMLASATTIDPQTGQISVVIDSVPALHINQSETHVIMQPDFDDQEHVDRALSTENDRFLSLIARNLSDADRIYAIGISQIEQFWSTHSGNPKPSWVDSDDKQFAQAIGSYYNIPVGQPQALLTNAGRDFIHQASFTTGVQPAAANFMAIASSSTATTPLGVDTTLVGEIATVGGGLIRKQGTYAHTAGTNTTTLTVTFTANSSDSLPVTASQAAVFNALSSGTLVLKTPLSANQTFSAIGDNVTVVEAIIGG